MNDASLKHIDPLKQTELFNKISDICATVNLVTETKELLDISLLKTIELVGARRGSIFIVKEKSPDLVLKSSYGMKVDEKNQLVKRMGEGVVGLVATSKKPIFVTDIALDERFQDYKARASYRTPSFICAPLLIKDKLLGVINIADKTCCSKFTRDELQILDFLATQIALNYRRIQLYQKFKIIIRQSKSLKDKLGKSSQEASHLRRQVILQEKLATIGKLAGGIAHEFNNPLDGVMRYTNLCLDHSKEDDVIHSYLLEIKNGLNRMANIVKSLLACSRNSHPTMLKVNINSAIEQALLQLTPYIIQKNVHIEKNFASGIPDLMDMGLERVLVNVIRNAIDAVAMNGEVGIITSFDGENIRMDIKDNGCGIEADDLDQIFEPFFTTKDIDKGCGLGLTIVSEIVKSYNGRIDIESSVGQGTTFGISIPIQRSHD